MTPSYKISLLSKPQEQHLVLWRCDPLHQKQSTDLKGLMGDETQDGEFWRQQRWDKLSSMYISCIRISRHPRNLYGNVWFYMHFFLISLLNQMLDIYYYFIIFSSFWRFRCWSDEYILSISVSLWILPQVYVSISKVISNISRESADCLSE